MLGRDDAAWTLEARRVNAKAQRGKDTEIFREFSFIDGDQKLYIPAFAVLAGEELVCGAGVSDPTGCAVVF
jgi:hypothetical protein